MEVLYEKYRQKLKITPLNFVRSIMKQINWKARLIGIKGARGVGKTTLVLQYTINLYKNARGISKLQKPNKIFLENTNLMYALASEHLNPGNLRETFFVNQIAEVAEVEYADEGDFTVDQSYVFEIGGKDKSFKQVKNTAASFVAADDIEYGLDRKIPLWLFGFLY